jgi:hypothetical protein
MVSLLSFQIVHLPHVNSKQTAKGNLEYESSAGRTRGACHLGARAAATTAAESELIVNSGVEVDSSHENVREGIFWVGSFQL